LHEAANSRVGTPTFAQCIRAAVDVQLLADRTVDDDHDRRSAGGRLQRIEIQFGIGNRFDAGDQRWHIFRFAAGHNSVDGDLLHRRLRPARRHGADGLFRIAFGRRQHLGNSLFSRRNDRQPVGPTFLLEKCLRVPDVVRYLESFRLQCRRCHDHFPLPKSSGFESLI
jgi:hypothetical protein